jgi:RNA polymerase sigma factor (sigma-70 family)
MEEQPPQGADAGRARADAAGGNQVTTLVNDLKVSKTQLYIDHLPLVRSIASRFRGRGLDRDELVNAGAVGLGDAIRRYRTGSNNGLAAFARKWIEGAIRRALKKHYWNVGGNRNEGGDIASAAVDYFGNVGKGDGAIAGDVSLNAQIQTDGEHGDDEDGGGTFLDVRVDTRLEAVTGDRWSRLDRHLDDRARRVLIGRRRGLTYEEIGAELDISDERCRQIEETVKAELADVAGNRRQPNITWGLLPRNRLYAEPAWAKKFKPTVFGPSEYYEKHRALLTSYDRVARGWAPKWTNSADPVFIRIALGYSTGVDKDDDRGPQAWSGWRRWKRTPQPKWKIKARKLPGVTLPKEAKLPVDWMVFRHVDYKGSPLDEPVRKTRVKTTKVARVKAPELPSELSFLSAAGVREWKKAAKRKPLQRIESKPHRRPQWQTPIISTVVLLSCLTGGLSTPSEPLPAISTRAHRPISVRLSSTG